MGQILLQAYCSGDEKARAESLRVRVQEWIGAFVFYNIGESVTAEQ